LAAAMTALASGHTEPSEAIPMFDHNRLRVRLRQDGCDLSRFIVQPRADFPPRAVNPYSLPTGPFGHSCDLAVQVTLLVV
jgi:hypothetical protein